MNIKKLSYMLVAALTLLLGAAACSPDDFKLGDNNITSADLQEGVAYTITHDQSNPNIVYLENKMGSEYNAQWETPQGRYQGDKVTLKMPFAGTYDVLFGVDTRSGVVYGDTTSFTIDNICTDFITTEIWNLLAGGVNGEKTWIYDDGTYGFSAGELTYGDPDANNPLTYGHFTANWDPGKGQCGDDAMWESTMTFSLKGSAGYKFYNSSTGATQSGVFSLNEDSYVLSLSDADLMHPDTWTARLADWRKNLQIIELDENHLRIGYKRQSGDWGGEWIEVFNYVSKDYADGYVPEVDDNPQPTLADSWQSDITSLYKSPNTYREFKFVLTEDGDASSYYNLYGKWESGSEAASSDGAEMSLKINSEEKTYTMTDADGNSVSGTYTLNSNGFIKFSNGLLTTTVGKNGAVLKTNADNTLRVLSYTMDKKELTDLVLGYDIDDVHGNRYKYRAFHFVPKVIGGTEQEYFKAGLHFFNSGWTFTDSPDVKITGDGTYTLTLTGTDTDPYGMYLDVTKVLAKYPNFDMTITGMRVDGKSIAFDDSEIEKCGGDETDAAGNKITARRYILNPWNSDNYFVAHGTSVLGFNSKLEVDIKVTFDSGTPFLSE